MGLKYADLEIRWVSLLINKGEGSVVAEVKTELGYYDTQKRWNKVRDHGTYVVDTPALMVLMTLPPSGSSVAEALDAALYGYIAQEPPYYAVLDIATPEGAQGLVTVEVPGRGTLTENVSTLPLKLPPAPRATVRVNLSGYQEAVWTGPLVGAVKPAMEFIPK
ncbi:hypothetical protein MN1_190 [Thermus phage MN1]|nr:hypothetical protein MN1_190 [Thermus phage MN1]